MQTITDTRAPLVTPQRFSQAIEDGVIHGWRWPSEGKPPLLFCHATGFCASTYKQCLGQLGDVFDVYAVDLRGHGRSALPADPAALRSWRPIVQDISEFLDRQNRRDWTLAGHSMGAITAMMAAHKRTDVRAVRLLDPVVVPSFISWIAATPLWPVLGKQIPLAVAAAARRDHWDDRETVRAHYARKPLFSRWAPGVLEDYLEDAVQEQDGKVWLSCAPAWEAAVFRAQANPVWRYLRQGGVPIKILAAGDLNSSTFRAAARQRFSRLGGATEVLEGAGHLFPMETPDAAARFLR